MKKAVVLLISFVLLWQPFFVRAGPQEDYEEAYKLYLAAGISAAAYSSRIGELATRYLEQDGWQIDRYIQAKGSTGARFLIAKKALPEEVAYFIAIVGTENSRDVKIDLKFDKVDFPGNAAGADALEAKPKVHRGFYKFVQSGPSAVTRNSRRSILSLPGLPTVDGRSKLYITGHSLGGAAATLAGAKLLGQGIDPQQLEVITFGAPAVGNAAFAAKFAPALRLTRVVHSGDPVTGILQTLVGGYHQFGREIKWTSSGLGDDPHRLAGYLDSAIKNYYDKRRRAVEFGLKLPAPPAAKQASAERFYIAPLQNKLPSVLTTDYWYMSEAFKDEYKRIFPDYRTADTHTDLDSWRKDARSADCRWVITSDVSAFRLKSEKNTYYITVTQTTYDVATGAAAGTAIFSTGTYNLTPLEAFIHTLKEISAR